MIGRSIGHYKVTGAIGAGGMGEVYRASDSRLSRDVAIKVLPAVFAADGERMARFEREARLLASLSHTNIASIFGLEEFDGTRAIVMELVEGETLAEHIARGALALDEALPIAQKVAEAIEYAHERGVIHRDLKPANIKITRDGEPKVLDFGLAKALDDDPSSSGPDLTKSPTLTTAGTHAGVILGTAAYMSPEQARGRAVDRRADIFSFGVLLFEMLSGRQVFGGETVSETLASVMKDEPDWSALPASVPPVIEDLIRRCLIKDPRQRLRDIGEARITLERAMRGESVSMIGMRADSSPSTPVRRTSIGRLVLIALPLVILAALAGWMLRPKAPATPLLSLDMVLPEGMRLDLQNSSLVLSPDGRTLALVAASPGEQQRIWLRRLDRAEIQPLQGTDDASYPFWSPDGVNIGFFANGKLKRIPAAGGVAQTIADAPEARGGAWGPDGTIVYAPGVLEGLRAVPASGGASRELTHLEQKGASHRLPCILPDGERALYVLGTIETDSAQVMCVNLRDGEQRTVFAGASEVRYLAPGYISYVVDGNLMVQRFNVDSLERLGEPIPVAQGVQFNLFRFTGAFSMAARGPLVYYTGGTSELSQLAWYDADGHEIGKLGEPGSFVGGPRISPDGKHVLIPMRDERFDLWMIDAATGVRTRFTLGPEQAGYGLWSPDGGEAAYSDGSGRVWLQSTAGSTVRRQILDMKDVSMNLVDWTPDGKYLVVNAVESMNNGDVWLVPTTDDGEPVRLLASPGREFATDLSPDGRWVLFLASESGRTELYAASRAHPENRFQISERGADYGAWTPDGRNIIYLLPDGTVREVAAEASGDRVVLGASRMGFGGKAFPGIGDMSRDGKRVLIAVPERSGNVTLSVVSDWREMIARRPR